jgi:hypothetical protein
VEQLAEGEPEAVHVAPFGWTTPEGEIAAAGGGRALLWRDRSQLGASNRIEAAAIARRDRL